MANTKFNVGDRVKVINGHLTGIVGEVKTIEVTRDGVYCRISAKDYVALHEVEESFLELATDVVCEFYKEDLQLFCEVLGRISDGRWNEQIDDLNKGRGNKTPLPHMVPYENYLYRIYQSMKTTLGHSNEKG